MRHLQKYKWIPIAMAMVLLLTACQSLKTAVFDQYSYQQAVSLKVESSNLLDKATTQYSEHEDEVEALLLELQKMVEYEKNKPHNDISYAMWQLFLNEDKNLLAGVLKRWKNQNTLSEVFAEEAKVQVMEAWDLLIKYEAQKNKTNETGLLNFLSNN